MNYGDYSAFPLDVLGLLAMGEYAKAKFEALPKEKQERILKERAENKERKRVNWFIQQGKCPYCGEKLTRGKKNKQNDYKRVWTCAYCDKVLQVEKGD